MSMDTALIRQRFSAASASYDAEAEAQQHIAAHLWALAAPHIATGAAVLEVGAGTGLYLRRENLCAVWILCGQSCCIYASARQTAADRSLRVGRRPC